MLSLVYCCKSLKIMWKCMNPMIFLLNHRSQSLCLHSEVNCCEKYAKMAELYRKKYYNLLRKYKNLNVGKKNQSLTIKKIKSSIDKIKGLNTETKTFCKLLLSPRPKEYTNDVKEMVQNIYYVSRSTYLFLRNKLHLNLPHISSLIRWQPIKFLQPGFTNTAIDFLKEKCTELQPYEKKNMVLLFDEMAIRRELRYNEKLDIIDGFEDNGVCRTKNIGKYVSVFMVRSIFSSWSVIINYFVSMNGLSAEELKHIILKNLNIIKSWGLNVKVITCDQGSSNRKCYSALGCSPENPSFNFDSQKVFCLFDIPHLVKSLRNGWLTCNMETLDGIASFQVVKEIWEKEIDSTTKMCPKITKQHIFPNSFEKMKVKLATQIFSHTVEAAIKTVNDTQGFKKTSKEIASNTASFIGKINKFFDCMNSSSLYSKSVYKSAIQLNNPAHEFLKYFKTYLQHMHFVNKSKKVFFLDGMAQTVNGVLELIEELFQQEEIFFLMTRNLNQDKLENTFAIFRQKGGNNTNPSIAEINNILARFMTIKMVQLSSNSNCEQCDETTINVSANTVMENRENEVNEEEENADMQVEESIDVKIDDLIDDFLYTDDISTDSVSLRYFVGYVGSKMLAKLKCEVCATDIRKDDENLSVPTELFIFHKNYSTLKDFGNLVAPTQSFFEISRLHINIFQNFFLNKPQYANIKAMIMEKCSNATPQWFSNCCDHKKKNFGVFHFSFAAETLCLGNNGKEENNYKIQKKKLKL